MAKQFVIIYHTNCVDGFTAAWCAWLALGDTAEYVPADYGDEPPDVSGKNVFVLDFSYPREVLVRMRESANSLYVLDHHKTAKDALAGLEWAEFDMTRSGAAMAWDYFSSGALRPMLVHYVQDRDLWKWELPYSREVSAYVATVEREFASWSVLRDALSVYFDDIVAKGQVAQRVVERYVENWKQNATRVRIGGHLVPCINTTFAHSEIIGELAVGEMFAAGWYRNSDGKYVYSLRSRPGTSPDIVDVSKVAAEYGGGGHPSAAGFKLNYLI